MIFDCIGYDGAILQFTFTQSLVLIIIFLTTYCLSLNRGADLSSAPFFSMVIRMYQENN